MQVNKKILFIAIGIVLIAIILGIKNKSLLQGKMFRFDDKKPIITNEIDTKNLSQSTKIDNSIAKTILNKNEIKNDLKNIWGIRIAGKSKTSIFCQGKKVGNSDYAPYTHGLKVDVNGIEVVFQVPNEVSLDSDEVKGGIMLIKVLLPKVQEYFGPYPCDRLKISKFFDNKGSNGKPGIINLFSDEFQGDPPIPVLNSYWLVLHELIHSYYYGSLFDHWLVEGVPQTIPDYVALKELENSIDWTLAEYEKETYSTPESAFQNMMNFYEEMLTDNKNAVTYSMNICEFNGEYEEATWGRTLLLDLLSHFDEKSVMQTLRIIYEKRLYIEENQTNEDFYDAFLYYVSKNNKTAVNQYDKAKTLLKEKLCL